MKQIETKRPLLWLGISLILLANVPLFSTQYRVNWDAFGEMWQYFRWMGSALREGYFPDFFPNILLGYPLGANIQAGVYNLFYSIIAFGFPDSVLSINIVYILTQLALFYLAFRVGQTYELGSLCNFYLGLALVASGYIIGHAEHFSYLATAVGLLACFLAMRLALSHKSKSAFTFAVIGVYHALTAGYPTNILFGAECLSLYWAYIFATDKNVRKELLLILCAVLVGGLLSLPALWHFWHQVSQSARGDGLDIGTAISGSLPRYGLLSFVFPLWKMWRSEPSIERFHLTFLGLPLTIIAIWSATVFGNHRRQILTWLGLAVFITILALGKNSPIPIRVWLAEHFFIFRVGRFPSGEHRGVALFLLALVSAFGLQWLQQRFSKISRALTTVIILDFLLVMYGLNYMRYSDTPPNYQGTVPRFKIQFNSDDQALLDAPRNCTPDGEKWPVTALKQQRDLAPAKFYWNGYVSLRDKAYERDRSRVFGMICGPSRLWFDEPQTPGQYHLLKYTPSYIQLIINDGDCQKPSKLIWADYNDGFWMLKINGEPARFETMPAKLRGFYARRGDMVEMVYTGPVSQLWRN